MKLIQKACEDLNHVVGARRVCGAAEGKCFDFRGPRNEEIMRESRLCSPDAGAHFCYVTVVMTDETQQSHD